MNKIIIFLKNCWKEYGLIIKIAVTIILFWILFSNVDIYESISYFSYLNWLILIPLALYPIGLLISTKKWQLSLKSRNDFWYLFKIYWISNFFSNFLPSSIGGDSYKVIKLKKRGLKRTILSIILDRGTGLFALILLLVVIKDEIYLLTKNNFISYFGLITLLIFIVTISFVCMFKFKNPKLYRFQKIFKNNKKLILSLISLSILFILLGGLSFWIYFFMFGYNLPFIKTFTIYILIQLITMIPISLNGLGLREGSLVYFLNLIGIESEVGLAIALISRLALLICSSVGGLIYIVEKDKIEVKKSFD